MAAPIRWRSAAPPGRHGHPHRYRLQGQGDVRGGDHAAAQPGQQQRPRAGHPGRVQAGGQQPGRRQHQDKGRHRQQQPDTGPAPGDQVGGENGEVAGDVGDEQAAPPRKLMTSALPAITLSRATGSCRRRELSTDGADGQLGGPVRGPGAAGSIASAPCWSHASRHRREGSGSQGQCLEAVAVQGSPGLLPSRCETSSMAANSSVAQVARTTKGWACW